jgi:hypothetical protein
MKKEKYFKDNTDYIGQLFGEKVSETDEVTFENIIPESGDDE